MRVFVVGATGYLGSAMVAALRERGDAVVGSARTEEVARKLRDAGIEAAVCDITAPESLKAPAQRCDGVIYVVQYNGADIAAVETAAISALVEALAGSGKPLLYTSGYWIYGSTAQRIADEDAPLNPTPLIAHRPALERTVLDGITRDVRAVVLRAGIVYGGGAGIPAMWVQSAKQGGAAQFIGDGRNHWAVVHRDDLAQLYVLAIEKAAAGSIYNAADDSWLTVREMAEAASFGAGRNGAVTEWPLEEARRQLGAYADALALDSRISSQRAHRDLGWSARATPIIDDLRTGSYASR
jgi:nucleoside-diphosphate-sugar epimerase